MGDESYTQRRFIRWRNKGVWEKLADNPDDEWLMVDASQINVAPHVVAAVKGNQKMSWAKGSSTQITLDRGSEWSIIRAGTPADCCQAESLRPGIQTQYLLTDKGYDSQAIFQKAYRAEMQPVIAPTKDRKYQRNYNQD